MIRTSSVALRVALPSFSGSFSKASARREISCAHRVISDVGVGGVGRDDVREPAEQAARADPQARRADQPQDASQDAPVVELELPYSGDHRAQNSSQSGITHRRTSPPFVTNTWGVAQGFLAPLIVLRGTLIWPTKQPP
jgi:hypothetical protein